MLFYVLRITYILNKEILIAKELKYLKKIPIVYVFSDIKKVGAYRNLVEKYGRLMIIIFVSLGQTGLYLLPYRLAILKKLLMFYQRFIKTFHKLFYTSVRPDISSKQEFPFKFFNNDKAELLLLKLMIKETKTT